MTSGNTPAHAGKTSHRPFQDSLEGKHPRACGEDACVQQCCSIERETPPRMRGRHFEDDTWKLDFRNTPAHAGKTDQSAAPATPARKHPRACGEDQRRERLHHAFRETPPRMRGRHWTDILADVAGRNTPAHAGKTGSLQHSAFWLGKHPRACGEDSPTKS